MASWGQWPESEIDMLAVVFFVFHRPISGILTNALENLLSKAITSFPCRVH